MNSIICYAAAAIHSFKNDEEGLALTEYLILLGLLTGAVVTAVFTFGEGLGTAWENWSTFFDGASAPAVTWPTGT